jgi:CheY-like chemotaxis protein
VSNDDSFQLMIMANMLKDLRYVNIVHKASNGQEALEKVNQNRRLYDIIILDLQMPILTGYEACEKIL